MNQGRGSQLALLAALVCGLVTATCQANRANPGPSEPGGMPPPPELAAPSAAVTDAPDAATPDAASTRPAGHPPGVALDCSGLGQNHKAKCSKSPDWLVDLHSVGNRLMEPRHKRPEKAVCDRARAALAKAAAATQLSVAGRVVALRVFANAEGCQDTKLKTAAARVVSATRPTPRELEALGGKPFVDLEAYVGPTSAWQQRRTRNVPLFHEQSEQATRAFRPLATDKARAIFGQLVAIDTAWQPHITSLVGRVEIRRSHAEDASACVAHLNVTRLDCSSGRLEPLRSVENLPISHFLAKREAGLSCRDCHGQKSMRSQDDLLFGDLTPLKRSGRPHLNARRVALLSASLKLVGRVKAALKRPAP